MSDDNKKLEQIKKADSLFSKKRLQEIENSISDEDKKRYAKIGEEMYNSINFEDINSQGKLASENAEAVEMENVSQIKLMLQSGIHPSYLSTQENDMMKNAFGGKWYEQYGFLETDLNRINF
jgi:hypothetical protein